MQDTLRLGGIDYRVIKQLYHPQIAGRKTLIMKRPEGSVRYVVTSYEDGSYSDVTKSPF